MPLIVWYVMTGELQHLAGELAEAKAALSAKASLCEQLSSSKPRLERRVELLIKERDSLKQILALYQEEVPKAAAAGRCFRMCCKTPTYCLFEVLRGRCEDFALDQKPVRYGFAACTSAK